MNNELSVKMEWYEVRSPVVDEKCSWPNRKMKAKILREFLGLITATSA